MSGPAPLRLLFGALVEAAGGVDAAAAVIAARWGSSASASHVSRMCGGSCGVTLGAVIALEDALGRWPVSAALAARRP